jgi:hypothetical protein
MVPSTREIDTLSFGFRERTELSRRLTEDTHVNEVLRTHFRDRKLSARLYENDVNWIVLGKLHLAG